MTAPVVPWSVPYPGACRWTARIRDVDYTCRDTALPGERLCADHYIEAVQAKADRAPVRRGAA